MDRRLIARLMIAALLITAPMFSLGAGKPTIAVVLKSMRNEFFVQMANGARGHHARNQDDYRLIVEGVQDETDVKGQEAIIRRLMAQHINALILVPADSVALLPMVLKAMKAGILIINVDNKLDDRALAKAGVNVPFVGPSNFNGAKSVGEFIARTLRQGSKVGLIEGPPGTINAKARSDGFRAALHAAGMQVAGIHSGYWETGRGREAATLLLKSNPDIRALLCGNDNMAIGAAQAVKAAGRKGHVLVGGYDHIPAIRPLIADGSVAATADQFPVMQVEYSLNLTLKALKSGSKQVDLPSIVQTPAQLVTKMMTQRSTGAFGTSPNAGGMAGGKAQASSIQVYGEAYPPLLLAQKGALTGPYADAFAFLAKQQGVEVHYIVMPEKRVLQMIERQPGSCGLAVNFEPGKAETVSYVGQLAPIIVGVYARKNQIAHISNIEELRRHTVGAIDTAAVRDLLDAAGIHYYPLAQSGQGLQMLRAGRFELLISDMQPAIMASKGELERVFTLAHVERWVACQPSLSSPVLAALRRALREGVFAEPVRPIWVKYDLGNYFDQVRREWAPRTE